MNRTRWKVRQGKYKGSSGRAGQNRVGSRGKGRTGQDKQDKTSLVLEKSYSQLQDSSCGKTGAVAGQRRW